MKVAIITYSCAFNYGAVLQTYGLYSYLKRNGHNPIVIDYIPERYNLDADDYAQKAMNRTRLWKLMPFIQPLWKKKRLSQIKQNRDCFRAFLDNYVKLTKKYYGNEELKKDPPEADVYITGSDQVWNPDFSWNGHIDEPYYLAFLDEEDYRISYASSFGKSELTEKESNEAYQLLKRYRRLSVRESSGVRIIEKMGLKAQEVADPTILAGSDAFSLIAKEPLRQDKYLLLFQIYFNEKLYAVCKEICKDSGLELIVIIPDSFQAKKCQAQEKIVLPTVEEWIGYFKNANYIVTDSFHASAFSIMFGKDFSSCTLTGYNGRIQNLLERTGLTDRTLDIVDKGKLSEQVINHINYDRPRKIVEEWQRESGEWLDNALAEGHNA